MMLKIFSDSIILLREINNKMGAIFVLPNSSQIVDFPIRLAPSIKSAFVPWHSSFQASILEYIFLFSITCFHLSIIKIVDNAHLL